MNINELVNNYISQGYVIGDAQSKVCQDIILYKIGKSKYSKNITIKDGVVMHNISKSMRRATRDLDLDFIKYSLDDESIINFINKLNADGKDFSIEIVGGIEKLHHQDYNGKRVYVLIKDNYDNILETKLDIGVHKHFELEQDNYLFDLGLLGDSISLLINSPEQIMCEKLKSLLKFGIRSTRYKDIFDFYYLINNNFLNKDKLKKYINILILEDSSISQNTMNDVVKRLQEILNNKRFVSRIDNARSNWIDLPANDVINSVVSYFNSLV